MDIFIKIVQLLFSLSILVVVHEFGHFAAARLFKTRVEKFYLFFNPWFSIFKFNYKGTEYGLGWLPLGGYVKISGMIDESMDKEQMKQEPKEWEFRSKPAWQRLIIMLGGVFMNIVLAFVIFIFMLAIYGEQYLPTSEVNKYGIAVDSVAYGMGFRDGDKILSIDGAEVEDFYQIPAKIILDQASSAQVIRDGKKFDIIFPEGSLAKLIKSLDRGFLKVLIPFTVTDFAEESNARDAGIREGDVLIAVNGEPASHKDALVSRISNKKGEQVEISLLRGTDTLNIPVLVSDEGYIGVNSFTDMNALFTFQKHSYNLAQAVPAGFARTVDEIGSFMKQLQLLVSPETKAYESVGGFIAIGNIFPSEWDWRSFWRLTAFLSIMLAILNLLPIPALDGGHVMFLLYEIIARRKPSDKFMEYAQVAGMILLLALLLYVNGNDVMRLING